MSKQSNIYDDGGNANTGNVGGTISLLNRCDHPRNDVHSRIDDNSSNNHGDLHIEQKEFIHMDDFNMSAPIDNNLFFSNSDNSNLFENDFISGDFSTPIEQEDLLFTDFDSIDISNINNCFDNNDTNDDVEIPIEQGNFESFGSSQINDDNSRNIELERETSSLHNQLFIANNVHQSKKKQKKQHFLEHTSVSKKFVAMTDNAIVLKDRFYSIFTTKKVFKKGLVISIHNLVVVPLLNSKYPEFRPVSRDEGRDIRLYFLHYAKYKDELLKCLEENKKLILDTILKDLDKKKRI